MDDEEIADKFFSMAMGEYAASIHDFIEGTRVLELRVRKAIQDEDHSLATQVSANLFHAVSQVQVGTLHNLITSYAHALNEERAAGVEVYDLGHEVLAGLRKLHQHLVAIAQPTQELSMVVDLMTRLGDGLNGSAYGQMTGDVPEA